MAEEVTENVQDATQTADVAAGTDAGAGSGALDAQQAQAAKDFEATPWTDELPESLRGDVEGLTSMEDLKEALKRGMEYKPATDVSQLEIKAPDGVEVDADMNKAFRELGVKIGLTPTQAQALMEFEVSQSQTLNQKAVEAATEELRQRWGANFEANSSKAGEMLLRLDAKMGNRLSAALGEGGLKNSPTLIEAFAVLGDLISEDSLAGGHSGGSSQQTETAEQMMQGWFK